jgi:hypothetical protein
VHSSRGIPLPEFWFPPGAKGFPWDELQEERNTLAELRYLQTERIRLNDLDQDVSPLDKEIDELNLALDGGTAASEPETTPTSLRRSQRACVACQEIAKVLWEETPEMRISEMMQHDAILRLGGGDTVVEGTLRRWLSAVAPREVSQKRGRPPNKNTPGRK